MLMVIELLVTQIPVYREHIWLIATYAFTYLAFGMIYTLSGGETRANHADCSQEANPNAFCNRIGGGACGNLFDGRCDIKTTTNHIYSVQDWADSPVRSHISLNAQIHLLGARSRCCCWGDRCSGTAAHVGIWAISSEECMLYFKLEFLIP